ncbi:MAG: hypothetical protein ACRC24_06065 [Vibrionaceae bacterium]
MVAPTGPAPTNGQGNITTDGDEPPKNGDEKKLSITGVEGGCESPETQGAAAPVPEPEQRMAIMHFAENLFEPDPLPRANRGRVLLAGASYLAEQQANRLNNTPPKPLRDNVFVSEAAALSMEDAAAYTRRMLIPEERELRAIFTTIAQARNHVTAVPAEQEGAAAPQVAPQGADGGVPTAPAPLIPTTVDWSRYSRIYISGHGAPGFGLLKQGDERFTAAQVAQLLIDSGALQHVKDIRITSSGSSQAQGQGVLPAPHQPDTERDGSRGRLPFVDGVSGAAVHAMVRLGEGFLDVFRTTAEEALADALEGQYRNTGQAFAQAVSRELAELGYPDVTVSGYAGAEMPLRDAGLDHHERRMNPFAADQEPIFQRRSEVRTQYRGGVIFRQPAEQQPAEPLGAAADPEQEDDE